MEGRFPFPPTSLLFPTSSQRWETMSGKGNRPSTISKWPTLGKRMSHPPSMHHRTYLYTQQLLSTPGKSVSTLKNKDGHCFPPFLCEEVRTSRLVGGKEIDLPLSQSGQPWGNLCHTHSKCTTEYTYRPNDYYLHPESRFLPTKTRTDIVSTL